MKRTAPLSNFENEIWEYLLGYFAEHTWGPTRKEIAEAIDSTPQQVDWAVLNMKRKGWLKLDERKWRNIIDPKEYAESKS